MEGDDRFSDRLNKQHEFYRQLIKDRIRRETRAFGDAYMLANSVELRASTCISYFLEIFPDEDQRDDLLDSLEKEEAKSTARFEKLRRSMKPMISTLRSYFEMDPWEKDPLEDMVAKEQLRSFTKEKKSRSGRSRPK